MSVPKFSHQPKLTHKKSVRSPPKIPLFSILLFTVEHNYYYYFFLVIKRTLKNSLFSKHFGHEILFHV